MLKMLLQKQKCNNCRYSIFHVDHSTSILLQVYHLQEYFLQELNKILQEGFLQVSSLQELKSAPIGRFPIGLVPIGSHNSYRSQFWATDDDIYIVTYRFNAYCLAYLPTVILLGSIFQEASKSKNHKCTCTSVE